MVSIRQAYAYTGNLQLSNGFYRPMRRAIGNLQLSMVSIGLCVGL